VGHAPQILSETDYAEMFNQIFLEEVLKQETLICTLSQLKELLKNIKNQNFCLKVLCKIPMGCADQQARVECVLTRYKEIFGFSQPLGLLLVCYDAIKKKNQIVIKSIITCLNKETLIEMIGEEKERMQTFSSFIVLSMDLLIVTALIEKIGSQGINKCGLSFKEIYEMLPCSNPNNQDSINQLTQRFQVFIENGCFSDDEIIQFIEGNYVLPAEIYHLLLQQVEREISLENPLTLKRADQLCQAVGGFLSHHARINMVQVCAELSELIQRLKIFETASFKPIAVMISSMVKASDVQVVFLKNHLDEMYKFFEKCTTGSNVFFSVHDVFLEFSLKVDWEDVRFLPLFAKAIDAVNCKVISSDAKYSERYDALLCYLMRRALFLKNKDVFDLLMNSNKCGKKQFNEALLTALPQNIGTNEMLFQLASCVDGTSFRKGLCMTFSAYKPIDAELIRGFIQQMLNGSRSCKKLNEWRLLTRINKHKVKIGEELVEALNQKVAQSKTQSPSFPTPFFPPSSSDDELLVEALPVEQRPSSSIPSPSQQ
jgi:hypothetical protein